MEEPFRRTPSNSSHQKIDIGSIVVLHSLKSARGAEFNGKRAIVISKQKVQDCDRWETKVEGRNGTTTMALKPENMHLSKISARRHPPYMDLVFWQRKELASGKPYELHERTYPFDDELPPIRARKLLELLDRPVHEKDYRPNGTVMMGVALSYYACVPESSMRMGCTIYDLEHITGSVSFAAMCQGEKMQAKGCGDGEREAVLFALLEAVPMSITVIMELLIRTPYIGPEEKYSTDVESISCRKRVVHVDSESK
jgi:hypothetical protein